MLALLGTLAVGATLAIHVEEVGDVPTELERALITRLVEAAESRAGIRVVVDDDRGGCLADQPCAAAIRSRMSTNELLLVRLIGGPLRVRVVLDHLGDKTRHVEADLPREGGDVAAVARTLVDATFDAAPTPEPAVVATAPPPERAWAPSWIATSLLGAGVASAAAGAAFGLSSQGALDDLPGAGSADEVRALDARASAHGTIANVLFVVAATAIVTGATAWITEDR